MDIKMLEVITAWLHAEVRFIKYCWL